MFTFSELIAIALYLATLGFVFVVYRAPAGWFRSLMGAAAIATGLLASAAVVGSYTGQAEAWFDPRQPAPVKRPGEGPLPDAPKAVPVPPKPSKSLPASTNSAALTPTPKSTLAGPDGTAFRDCAECPEMVTIPAGPFPIGALASDGDARPTEQPHRMAEITKRYAIGRYEVTVAQYAAYANATRRPVPTCLDKPQTEPRLPIQCVTWSEARAYALWLAVRTEARYRLPSEAEWERAARGGKPTRYAAGSTLPAKAANIGGGEGARAVGSFASNPFGLFDMMGNVAEHVTDCWEPHHDNTPADGRPLDARPCPKRTVKDGYWAEDAKWARVSARRAIDPAKGLRGVGFRVMRELN